MRSQQDVVIARAQVGVMLKRLEGRGADLSPQQRGAFNGIYGALCWVLEIPNHAAQQFERLVGGHRGDPLPPPVALDLSKMVPGRPEPEEKG